MLAQASAKFFTSLNKNLSTVLKNGFNRRVLSFFEKLEFLKNRVSANFDKTEAATGDVL